VAASPASPASRCAVHLLGFDELRHLKPAMFTLPRFHSDLRGRLLLGIVGHRDIGKVVPCVRPRATPWTTVSLWRPWGLRARLEAMRACACAAHDD